MKKVCTASLVGVLIMVLNSCMVELVICASNFTDQMALLAFKSSITLDPHYALRNWTTATNFCGWAGIICSARRQRVNILVLRDMGLQGTISPHLGNLSFLQRLDLRNNSFHGALPNEIGQLTRLKGLIVERNMLEGKIPVGLQQCRHLQVLALTGNNFTGTIPSELSSLPLMRTLLLGVNNLTGTIPPSFGNMSRLEYFGVEFNHISGNIPAELVQLPNLIVIGLHANNLTGSIPPGIFNKSSMNTILLNHNAFSGILPTSTGLWLPNLEILYLNINKLRGNIPSYLSNSSKLTILFLSRNSFTGAIPKSLGNLNFLQQLELSDCKITGTLPEEIGYLRNLILLGVFGNNLSGNIPPTIGGMERLQVVYLNGNNFKGSIPTEICLLKNLGELYFDENNLSGPIPSCIGNLSSLQVLIICSNKLEQMPSSLWDLQNLRFLNLSFNSIGGNLSASMKASNVLEGLDLSWNQISGYIPSNIGSFKSLTSLGLSMNSFSGSIPNSLGNLITLDFLDLSHNNISGQIPKSLEALSHLHYLNLSNNQLSGEIPSGGAFTNFTSQSFKDNEALCGSSILQVPPCASRSHHKSRLKSVLLQYILPAIALLVIIACVLYIVKRYRGNKVQQHQSHEAQATMEHTMISYRELCHATDDFCEANLLGVGSYGSVYKGVLSDGKVVAVKVLNLHVEGAVRSFDAKCKVLRITRHRNLVRVITSCSNQELRALVLEYMSNGSLEKWLYSHNYCLNLLQRVSIMIDVALALEYLHDGQPEPVVHCDLKPSNVLLDDDMVGHVADFGIAKILAENGLATQTNTLGTMGYIAPEYGTEGRVSTSGDLYSYGILLLETFTRKKPTDEMFVGEVNLRQWVSTSLREQVMEVVDSGLSMTENGGDIVVTPDNLYAVLELGLECSKESPTERIDIKEVVGKLSEIKKQLLIGKTSA